MKEITYNSEEIIFEGMTSLRAIIKGRNEGSNSRRILRVLADGDEAKHKSNAPTYSYLRHEAERSGYSFELCESEYIDTLAQGKSHGGVLAVCSERELTPLCTGDIKPGGFYVYLDGVEDPFNFGFAVRSLYAAGALGIILPPRNWMNAAGVVARSSAGASELALMYTAAPGDAPLLFRERGYRIVCADMRQSESLFSADLTYPLLLIIGGERRGISRSVLDLADLRVSIPYGRDFPAALSAASASAVISFEILRRNV